MYAEEFNLVGKTLHNIWMDRSSNPGHLTYLA